MNPTPTYFAAAKVILLGEHAVVHGVPALAAAMDRGARAQGIDEPSVVIATRNEQRSFALDAQSDIATAWRTVVAAAGEKPRHQGVRIALDVPPGAGLGSSAAVGLALIRSLYPERAQDPVWHFAIGQAWENVFHGTSSGIDVACSMNGGAILFSRATGAKKAELAQPLFLVIATSGQGAKTSDMVASVARQLAQSKERVGSTFAAIDVLIRSAVDALRAGDVKKLGHLMNDNHRHLQELELSTARLERLCASARAEGALGAKLTGAGGGGSIVALARSLAEQSHLQKELSAVASEYNGEAFATCVRAETTSEKLISRSP